MVFGGGAGAGAGAGFGAGAGDDVPVLPVLPVLPVVVVPMVRLGLSMVWSAARLLDAPLLDVPSSLHPASKSATAQPAIDFFNNCLFLSMICSC